MNLPDIRSDDEGGDAATRGDDAREPGRFARRFARRCAMADGVAFVDDPATRAGGVDPHVRRCLGPVDEANACVRWLLERRRAGDAWRDMAVLAPGKRNWRDPLAKALTRDGIPHRMLLGDPSLGPDVAGDHVHVMTLYAVEGLAFPAIAIVGIGDLPWKRQTPEEAARLLHVAMTRATRALSISYTKSSVLVERLLSA